MKFAGRFFSSVYGWPRCAALLKPFGHCQLTQDKAKLSGRDMWSTHTKQWRLTQRPSCQRRGNWPTAYRPTIYYSYLVENQTTTAKASHDSRLPRVLFEEKEERFLIPTTRMCWWDVQNNFWAAKGASCAAKAWTAELFCSTQQHRT